MESIIYVNFIFVVLFIHGAHSATFSIRNNCGSTIWPGILTSKGTSSSTGMELAPQAAADVNLSGDWSGRVWARTFCGSGSGKFSCETGDCGSGQVPCNGAGGAPPVSLVEFTLGGDGGKDFYDISLVDGFNLPVQISPQGGGGCSAVSCPVDINNQGCPADLVLRGSGGVIGCKSACVAFGKPEYCCTGDYSTPDKCKPSQYSEAFKQKCPQAYSYAYDDKTSTFTCPTGPNYAIVFCP